MCLHAWWTYLEEPGWEGSHGSKEEAEEEEEEEEEEERGRRWD